MSPLQLVFVLTFVAGVYVPGVVSKPPHCTTATKNGPYEPKFELDYATVVVPEGQKDGVQELFCKKLHKEVTEACDWAAPPKVTFAADDSHVKIERQDPEKKYLGNVEVKTTQLCEHGFNAVTVKSLLPVYLNKRYPVTLKP